MKKMLDIITIPAKIEEIPPIFIFLILAIPKAKNMIDWKKYCHCIVIFKISATLKNTMRIDSIDNIKNTISYSLNCLIFIISPLAIPFMIVKIFDMIVS